MKTTRGFLFGCTAWCGMLIIPCHRAEAAREDHSTPIIESRLNDKTIAAENWQLSKPPYPLTLRASHEQGSFYVEIITGANGRVVSASVPRSREHPRLNLYTAKWAYLHWSGPPNHKARVPVTYILLR